MYEDYTSDVVKPEGVGEELGMGVNSCCLKQECVSTAICLINGLHD